MKTSMKEKIEQHKAFLKKEKTDRPLIGFINGWENLSRYVQDTEAFFPKGDVVVQDIVCERFLPMYRNYAKTLDEQDSNLFFTLEPPTFFPWTEAALGCPITYTGKNFWSKPMETMKNGEGIEQWIDSILGESGTDLEKILQSQNIPERSKQWVARYGEFLDFLAENFDERYPIGQSVLRGPLDMASAAFGEDMVFLFFDRPHLIKKFLFAATAIYLSFIKVQKARMRRFENGYVIGTYYIWTPDTCLRFQEDAMSLLSPKLYKEFVDSLDRTIASHAQYSLFHLHSTGLDFVDLLLENKDIRILQVSKDEGGDLQTILPSLKKIQKTDKSLILKGRMSLAELQIIKQQLDFRGLCIQAIVLNQQEAEDILSVFD